MSEKFNRNGTFDALLKASRTNPDLLNDLSAQEREALRQYEQQRREQTPADQGRVNVFAVTRKAQLADVAAKTEFISERGMDAYLDLPE